MSAPFFSGSTKRARPFGPDDSEPSPKRRSPGGTYYLPPPRHTRPQYIVPDIGKTKQRKQKVGDDDFDILGGLEVEMGMLWDTIKDQTRDNHVEIERRLKIGEGAGAKADMEKHLLTTPPVTPTKFTGFSEGRSINEDFDTLVERDRNLHYLENDLIALQEFWKANRATWIIKRERIIDINDSIEQFKYQKNRRTPTAVESIGISEQISLLEKTKSGLLQWFVENRKLMKRVHDEFRRIARDVNIKTTPREEHLRPTVLYSSTPQIRAAIAENDWSRDEMFQWFDGAIGDFDKVKEMLEGNLAIYRAEYYTDYVRARDEKEKEVNQATKDAKDQDFLYAEEIRSLEIAHGKIGRPKRLSELELSAEINAPVPNDLGRGRDARLRLQQREGEIARERKAREDQRAADRGKLRVLESRVDVCLVGEFILTNQIFLCELIIKLMKQTRNALHMGDEKFSPERISLIHRLCVIVWDRLFLVYRIMMTPNLFTSRYPYMLGGHIAHIINKHFNQHDFVFEFNSSITDALSFIKNDRLHDLVRDCAAEYTLFEKLYEPVKRLAEGTYSDNSGRTKIRGVGKLVPNIADSTPFPLDPRGSSDQYWGSFETYEEASILYKTDLQFINTKGKYSRENTYQVLRNFLDQPDISHSFRNLRSVSKQGFLDLFNSLSKTQIDKKRMECLLIILSHKDEVFRLDKHGRVSSIPHGWEIKDEMVFHPDSLARRRELVVPDGAEDIELILRTYQDRLLLNGPDRELTELELVRRLCRNGNPISARKLKTFLAYFNQAGKFFRYVDVDGEAILHRIDNGWKLTNKLTPLFKFEPLPYFNALHKAILSQEVQKEIARILRVDPDILKTVQQLYALVEPFVQDLRTGWLDFEPVKMTHAGFLLFLRCCDERAELFRVFRDLTIRFRLQGWGDVIVANDEAGRGMNMKFILVKHRIQL